MQSGDPYCTDNCAFGFARRCLTSKQPKARVCGEFGYAVLTRSCLPVGLVFLILSLYLTVNTVRLPYKDQQVLHAVAALLELQLIVLWG